MSMARSRHGNSNDMEEEEAPWMGLQQRKNRCYRDAGTSPSPSSDRTPLVRSQTQSRQQQLQPRATKNMMEKEKVVDVVYYLSRNGLLEQPHFMEVPLSSPAVGLHLRDVIARLDSLRGRGLAAMYCWSSKRNYKGGYVWQDLSEDDLIHPRNDGQEYVLKGSRLLHLPSSRSFRSSDATPSPSLSSKNSSYDFHGTPKTGRNRTIPHTYEARSTAEFVRNSTDASTQTDGDKGRTAFPSSFTEELRKVETQWGASASPPPGSSSSNEGMEDGINKVGYGRDIRNQVSEGERPSGRMKAASSALMQLIMCIPKSAVDGGGVDTINNVHV
ncbi:hypothetical protein MLD38_002618 [Melastoma candidum]|uniref:Uncharacterized protein n=1 Tax=Melastoma candidum TaxID=119954 RepID=A0ACB9RZK9_9MYRT|nr:hypothetical protein MLD38_002618 [Melastoma candidum]